jgi:IS5 family transposase
LLLERMFRRLLEKHCLSERLFAQINTLLSQRGLFVGKGTIVDATIIHAPPSTKNTGKKRDPEMHQTTKGKQWFFGMKVHTGVDAGAGLAHTVQGTSANVHDVTVLGKLLPGAEEKLHGDSAYHSKQLKPLAEESGLEFKVCEHEGVRWRCGATGLAAVFIYRNSVQVKRDVSRFTDVARQLAARSQLETARRHVASGDLLRIGVPQEGRDRAAHRVHRENVRHFSPSCTSIDHLAPYHPRYCTGPRPRNALAKMVVPP